MKDTGKLPLPEPLLAVRDLGVTFDQGGSATQAVRDVSFELHPGETLALVGESGLGQVRHRPLHRPPPARQRRHHRLDPLPRHRDADRRRAHPPPHPRQRHQLHLPGADDLAEPAPHHREAARRKPRPAPGPDRRPRPRPHPRPPRPASASATPRSRLGRLPAPALRRPAPAGDDRHGAGQRPRHPDRRRADHRARRHRPGPHPRPPRRGPEGRGHGRCSSSPTTSASSAASPTASR